MRLWVDSEPGNDPARRVLVLPGARYGIERPGLAWPARALTLRGWQVWTAEWSMPMDQPSAERQPLVDAAVADFVQQNDALPQLVLAKSVGTLAAGWVADHSIPALWTTPLLIDDECVSNIARASSPALLIAGSRDHTWDDDGARRAATTIHRIRGADHGWQTGDWRTELDAVEQLTREVERFAATLED